jgi:hypothetical protein
MGGHAVHQRWHQPAEWLGAREILPLDTSHAEPSCSMYPGVYLLPNPRRAPATHRHARDSAGRLGAGRGGINGNKEGRASRGDGRERNGSREQSAVELWAAGGEAVRQGHFDGKKEPYWPCPPLWRWDDTEGVHWNEFQKTASPHLTLTSGPDRARARARNPNSLIGSPQPPEGGYLGGCRGGRCLVMCGARHPF